MSILKNLLIVTAVFSLLNTFPSSMAQPLPGSVIRERIEMYQADLRTLTHRFQVAGDTRAIERRHEVLQDWLIALQDVNYAALNKDEQISIYSKPI